VRIATDTPVGMLRAIVILPSRLDVPVFHRYYVRLAPAGARGHERRTCDCGCAWIMGEMEVDGAKTDVREIS